MFMQFLKYRKPSVPLVQCNSDHVIEFLKHLNKFGDIRVHMQSCVLFGHPNPAASCFCPLREAWGTLEAIATRLRVAYEENRLPYMEPFASRDIQSYLNEVRKSQENALGIPSKKHNFPLLTVENSSPKKGDLWAGRINIERQGFRSPGAVTESIKLIEHPQEDFTAGTISNERQGFSSLVAETELSNSFLGTINNERQGFRSPGAVESIELIGHPQEYFKAETISNEIQGFRSLGALTLGAVTELSNSSLARSRYKRARDSKSAGTKTEPLTELQVPTESSMRMEVKDSSSTYEVKEDDNVGSVKSARDSKSAGTRTEASSKLEVPIETSMSKVKSFIMDDFRTILQVKTESRAHNLSVDPGSTTFPVTSTQGSSSTYEVKEDDYVISNTMSPDVSFQLRNIAVNASSKGCIQPLVEIYIAVRKTMMQSRFIQFTTEKWSAYDVKRFEWGVLESLIEIWIKLVKTSFDYLFASEKQLCEKIFHGLGIDIDDICFEVITQDYQVQVFNIIYTLSFTNAPPDKLFIILDLYETLDHFLNERCSFAKQKELFQATVRTQWFTVLSDKITSSLSIFEMVLLYHESSDVFVGAVDPLPMYVMSYLYQLCDHMHALRKLSLPKLPSIDEDDLILHSEELKGRAELSRHVIWIIMMIMSNLEGKAKLCQDGSAGQFFAMKNISYIVNKIEGHQELMEVVGDDYFGKLIQKLDHAKVNYVRLELAKIIEMRDYGA